MTTRPATLSARLARAEPNWRLNDQLDQLGSMTSSTNSRDVRPSISTADPPRVSPTRANVLLVDDQPAKLLTYEAILSGLGVRCVRALSAKEALEQLLIQEFAVLILDVHMPEMDGFELAALIREHPRLERVPLIFITGVHITELDRLRGYEAGAIDYISVPVVPEILRSKVALFVELHLKRDELQRLNQELKEARARLEVEHARALTDKDAHLAAVLSHPDQFFIVVRAVTDPSGVIRDWFYVNVNDAALPLFGMAREELIGKSMREVLPDRFEQAAAMCLRALQSHEPVRYETSFKTRDLLVTLYAAGSDTVAASSVDVTDRNRAERALREHERRTSALLQDAPVAIGHFGLDGRFEYVNTAYCDLVGYSGDELLHMRWQDVTHPDDLQTDSAFVHSAFKGELPHYTMEKRYVRKDGRVVWVSLFGNFVRDEASRPIQGVAIAVDVTERKQAEKKSHESEQRFRNMAEHAPVMIWVTDPSGNCLYLNSRWYEFTGQTPQGAHGLGWLDAVHPDDRGRVHEEFARANAIQADFRLEYRLKHRDGRYHWVIDAAAPRIGNDRAFAGYVGSVIEITERKKIEEVLRQSERRFRELADAMPQIVFTATADGSTDYLNSKWYELTEVPRESIDDEVWASTLHPDDRQPCLDSWYRCVRTGTPYQIEYRLNFPGKGGYRWHLGRALPVRNEAGEIVRWYGTCTDIHDLRLAQEALRVADKRKDEFLATLAHELRNPLAPVRSAVEYLRLKSPLDPKLDNARLIIDRQTKVMVRLVDDLLDLSRITRGRISLQKECVSVEVLLQNAIDACRPMIQTRGHDLVLRVPPDPVSIEGDVTRLSQVLANVLSNAAKYTPSGGRIEVTQAFEGTMVVVSVSDNGVGIPPDMVHSIFDMFVQVESTIHRSHGGLGIGLTLARQLVEMHGGRITARSDGVGRGSEFKIHLPATALSPTQPAEDDPAMHVAAAKRRILLADDNIDAAQTLRLLIELLGHEVHIVHDGLEAVESFSTFQPDIVLLDIGMPGLSGYEVATRIRAMPNGRRVALVAISGWGQESDRRAARQAGFDHHLTKPVELHQLRSFLERPPTESDGADG